MWAELAVVLVEAVVVGAVVLVLDAVEVCTFAGETSWAAFAAVDTRVDTGTVASLGNVACAFVDCMQQPCWRIRAVRFVAGKFDI